jgi:hypothetical protein
VVNSPSDHYVDVRKLEQLLEYDYLTTSYKLFWFLGIFNEIIRGNQRITFRRIVCRMIAAAWYPLLQYNLNFGVSDKLNDIVTLIHSKYGISSDINEEDLLLTLEDIKNAEVEKAINDFYKYVLIGSFPRFFLISYQG